MKKIFFMFLFCFSFCLFAPAAYAGQENVTSVEITGGVNFEKERISTFDDSEQISGTAENGTNITIVLYTVNSKGVSTEREKYEISVGKSRLFSQSVDLRLGENRIEISALKEGKEVFSDSVIVNRKESFIKHRLESSIYLPGSGI